MTRKLASISEAAAALGVSIETLRRWEVEGKLVPTTRTAGGQRRYDLAALSLPGAAAQGNDELLLLAVDFLGAVREGNNGKAKALQRRISALLAKAA